MNRRELSLREKWQKYYLAATLLITCCFTPACFGEVILENNRFRLTLSDAGVWTSLIERETGRELCQSAARLPMAAGRIQGKEYPVTRISSSGGSLLLQFSNGTTLSYRVTTESDWIHFILDTITGPRFEQLDLMRVPVTIIEHVGARLNIAWDDRHCVCLMAATRQVDCGAGRTKDFALLRARTQDAPGPKMEGASVALIVCPTREFRTTAKRASHAFGLLTNETSEGTPSKDTELARGSYWFLGGVGPKRCGSHH